MFPVYNHPSPSTEATDHPGKPTVEERQLLKKAAAHARLVLPGPIGEYLGTDLDSWAQMSLRFDERGKTRRLVEALFAMETGS